MDSNDWLKLKHFSIVENWGDKNLIKAELVFKLDIYRDVVKTPIYISCGTQGKHCVGSEHYTGEAVDVLFTHSVMEDAEKLMQAAEQLGFSSAGAYNCWELHGVATLGFHLGIRPVKKMKKWIGIEGMYLPWNEVNVKRYFKWNSTT